MKMKMNSVVKTPPSEAATERSEGRKNNEYYNYEEVVELKKGPWTAEEDQLLVEYVKTQGEGGWRTLPRRAGLLRCGKSCRLRWMNYLRPNVKRGHISHDEEDLILRLHRLLGNRWSLIAGRIPGRTDNEIKNYWNTHLSKKLIRQGIDPRTHKAFANNNTITSTDHNDVGAPSANPSSAATVSSIKKKKEEDLSDDDKVTKDSANNINWDAATTSNTTMMVSYATTNNDDDADDLFSSFLNSLINNDDMIFPCTNW